MRRDLVFFLSGLSFGFVGGYFLFRALVPGSDLSDASGASGGAPPAANSSIGLEPRRSFQALDEEEAERLETRAREDASDASVRERLGTLYVEAGLFGEAVPWLEEAVRLAPDELGLRNLLAVSYLNLGRLDDAVAAYEEALDRDPNHPASLLGLGRIKLYVQQDFGGGLALWERLVQVAPASPEARSVRDELEALKTAHSGA